jgi:hypothetical protein
MTVREWGMLLIGVVIFCWGAAWLARMRQRWNETGRQVDRLADIDAYDDVLPPAADWVDEELTQLYGEIGPPELFADDPEPGPEPRAHVVELPEEHERMPQMMRTPDGFPVFLSLLESIRWENRLDEWWGKTQSDLADLREFYAAAERCWAGVATGLLPAVTA